MLAIIAITAIAPTANITGLFPLLGTARIALNIHALKKTNRIKEV